jgi:uncharacterized protein
MTDLQTPTPQTSNAEREVPTRRISFEEALRALPKHFAEDGDIVGSHLIASLSAVFPDGEDFFVRSVRHYRKDITDPDLKRQVSGFIGQEAIHGREHRDFNTRLAELGYPTKQVERFTKKGLALRERIAPPASNLAATAALEHFTATLAESILGDERTRDMIGDETVKGLFLWHALEESEHKAVAFDVYKAIGGTERMRVWTMKLIRWTFVIGLTLQVLVSVAMDPYARRHPLKVWRSVRKLVASPLISRETWEILKDYDRPDFHPDDRDTDELVARWREELFGDAGTLNDKLASRAA